MGVLEIQGYSENPQWDKGCKMNACGSPQEAVPGMTDPSLSFVIVADEAFGPL